MSEPAPKTAAWAYANRLLDGLAASLGNKSRARLGGVDLDDWQERAAIMEYDGGLSREAAERFARILAELGPASPPEALAAFDGQLRALDARPASAASARARRA